MRPIRIFLIIILFSSCNQTQKNNENVFSVAHNVRGELFIPAEQTGDPHLISVLEDHLILGNYQNSSLIDIYNLSSRQQESSFLIKGNGPLELLALANIQTIPETRSLIISDLFQHRTLEYPLDSVLNDRFFKPTVLYDNTNDDDLLFVKMFKGRQHLVAESRDPQGRILLLNSDRESDYFIPYPDKNNVDNHLSDIHNASLYSSAMTLNSARNKIALAAYNAGMIDIFEIADNEVVPYWSYLSFYPSGIMLLPMGDNTTVAYTQESTASFLDISSSDKYVYSLYSGQKRENPRIHGYGKEVFVLNWDGTETYKILLDQSINRLAVDARDEYLYGITPEMDIFRFKIPEENEIPQ